jgi:hypothetical protein
MMLAHVRSVHGRVLAVMLAVCLLGGSLSACGGSAVPTQDAPSGRGGASYAPTAAAASERTAASSAPAASYSGAAPAAAAPSSAVSAAPKSGAPSTGSGTTGQTAPASTAPAPTNAQPRLLIKTGTLGLTVRDVDAAFGRAGAIARQYGGDVLQYTNSKNGERRVADVTLQVDSGQFEAAMAALRELPDVVERRTDKAEATDVTEEFVDVQAQITNLEATERQLRDIMAKATRTEDILNIQREITGVRSQIERLKGRANYLDRRAALSTIALHLETPVVATAPTTPPELPGWRFTTVVANAWAASLHALQGIGTVVISVAVFCWWLLPLAALAFGGFRLLRRRGRGGATGGVASAGD